MSDSAASEVGRSGLLVLIGTIIGMSGEFIFRLSLANLLTQTQFGSIMLALSILTVVSIPVVAGLNQGLTKFIPDADDTHVNSYVTASLLIVVVFSLIWMSTLLLNQQRIADILFDNQVDAMFVFLFLLIIPFYAMMQLVHGALRGYMATRPFIVVSKLIKPLSKILLATGAALFATSTNSVLISILVAFLITVLSGLVFLNRLGWSFDLNRSTDYASLLLFSLPLIISSSVYSLLTRVDRIFIGFYQTPADVGVYEVSITIALLLGIFKNSFAFLLFPKVSEIGSEKSGTKVSELYTQVTKWILILTTPAFLVLIIRPDFLINLFGDQYTVSEVHLPLIVLSIGFFLHAIVGPNGQALLGFGESRKIMVFNIVAFVANVVLNILLIPIYGLVGAAIAATSSYALMNILKSLYLYQTYDVPAIKRESVLPCLFGAVVAAPFLYVVSGFSMIVEFLFLAVVGCISLLASSLYLILSGNVTDSDRELVETVFRI